MSITEIVSDACFIGWPTVVSPSANRQVAYLFLEADEQVLSEGRDDGETVIRSADGAWFEIYPPSIEPVIIRRSR